jgi:quercetin dioxygenase-like cupin family protein
MHVKRSASSTTQRGSKDWFTGTVWLDEIAVGVPPSVLRAHSVTFEPGARTAWHTHPVGQVLHVLSGVGRVQQAHGPVREICPGDTVWINPGEAHWHGAAPDCVFVHLAIQEATAGGEEAQWFQHVSDEEYKRTPSDDRPTPPGLEATDGGCGYFERCRDKTGE